MTIGNVLDRPIWLDRLVLSRIPRSIPVTARGLGPFRWLHMNFSSEQWARLLYD